MGVLDTPAATSLSSIVMKRCSLRSTGGEALASLHSPEVLARTIRALLEEPPAPSEVVTEAEIESAGAKPPPGVLPETAPPVVELHAATLARTQAGRRMRRTPSKRRATPRHERYVSGRLQAAPWGDGVHVGSVGVGAGVAAGHR